MQELHPGDQTWYLSEDGCTLEQLPFIDPRTGAPSAKEDFKPAVGRLSLRRWELNCHEYFLSKAAELLQFLGSHQPEPHSKPVFPVHKVYQHIALRIVTDIGAAKLPLGGKLRHTAESGVVYPDRHSVI